MAAVTASQAAVPAPSAAPAAPAPAAGPAAAIPNVSLKAFQPHNFARTFTRDAAQSFDGALAATQKAISAHDQWIAQVGKDIGAEKPSLEQLDQFHKHSVVVYLQRKEQETTNTDIIGRIQTIIGHKAATLKLFEQRGSETQAQLRELDLEAAFKAKQAEAKADIEALEERLPHIIQKNEDLKALNTAAYAILNPKCRGFVRDANLHSYAQGLIPAQLDYSDYVTQFDTEFKNGAFNPPAAPAPQAPSAAPAAAAAASAADSSPMALAVPASAGAAASAAPAPGPAALPAAAPVVVAPAVVAAVAVPVPTAAPAPAAAPVKPIVGMSAAAAGSGGPGETPQNTARDALPPVGAPKPLAPAKADRSVDFKHSTSEPKTLDIPQLTRDLGSLADDIDRALSKKDKTRTAAFQSRFGNLEVLAIVDPKYRAAHTRVSDGLSALIRLN